MTPDDADLVALFAAEAEPARDPAFVAAVDARVARLRRRRLALTSAAGLGLGLAAAAALALLAPMLGEAGRMLESAARGPLASWAALAAGLALAVGVPLLRGR